MQFFCFQNGTFLPQKEAKLEITNLGFTRGYCAFELFRTYEYTPFFLAAHLKRLEHTASRLLLKYPDNLESIIDTFLEKNRHPNLVVRLYLSEDESGKSQILILCDPIQLPPKKHYLEGIPVITTELTRHFHHIKTTCYLAALVALKEASKKQAEDALFTSSDGHLLEFTKSNFFAVINGTLYTPKEGVLFGITRSIVIQLANECNIPLIEGPIPKIALPTISEAFSTSTIREILPISSIDSIPIKLGPITKTLQDLFSLKKQEPALL
jgi:branched-subunit amino acid aminotransferase/4-amino-4-deoxychorismate lyase